MTEVVTREFGLQNGAPDLKSIGPIAIGPRGILFVADNAAATIFAIDIGDATTSSTAGGSFNIDNLDARLAAYLGCGVEDVHIRDLAVPPGSHTAYLSVMRGSGNAGVPLLVTVTGDGQIAEVPLDNVPFSKTSIDDAPLPEDERQDIRLADPGEPAEEREIYGVHLRLVREPLRSVTVTDMAYVDGMLLVAGASNEEFSSTLRRIPFPFEDSALSNSLEIYHVSHGQYETASPLRSFVPYGGGSNLLATYTCTPVVHFSLTDLESGALARGRTVADLGPMNTPLDMISYSRDGREYLLVSNARHPLMKIACQDIDAQAPLTDPQTPVGVPRAVLPQPGVSRMANLDDAQVLMLQREPEGGLHLRAYSTASL